MKKANFALPAVFFLSVFFCFNTVGAGPFDSAAQNMTIVLDPGHGGETDFGAKGPNGKLEKDITLRLAGMIAAGLENRYNIILTRTEDTDLDIPARTAVANHFKAALFISIHAGGGFVYKTRGVSICYFKDNYQEAGKIGAVREKPAENSGLPVTWEKIQKKHEQLSSDLAILVGKHLSGKNKVGEIRISSANYAVLEGADMPAILIEAGYLTNPSEEEALSDKDYIGVIVNGLSLAVDEYFQNISLQEKIKHGN